jgi:hypothetical protein
MYNPPIAVLITSMKTYSYFYDAKVGIKIEIAKLEGIKIKILDKKARFVENIM